jgi:hypothetical protein
MGLQSSGFLVFLLWTHLTFYLDASENVCIYVMEVKDHSNIIGHILLGTVKTRHQPKELGHVRDTI